MVPGDDFTNDATATATSRSATHTNTSDVDDSPVSSSLPLAPPPPPPPFLPISAPIAVATPSPVPETEGHSVRNTEIMDPTEPLSPQAQYTAIAPVETSSPLPPSSQPSTLPGHQNSYSGTAVVEFDATAASAHEGEYKDIAPPSYRTIVAHERTGLEGSGVGEIKKDGYGVAAVEEPVGRPPCDTFEPIGALAEEGFYDEKTDGALPAAKEEVDGTPAVAGANGELDTNVMCAPVRSTTVLVFTIIL